jgi:hypothetical protein
VGEHPEAEQISKSAKPYKKRWVILHGWPTFSF